MKSTLTAIIALLVVTILPGLSAVESDKQARHAAYVPGKRDYESSAVIQMFEPRGDVILVPNMAGEADNKRRLEESQKFFADQKKAIVADKKVRIAVRDLMPHFTDHQEATDFMRAELVVEQIEGTDLLKVIVRSGDKRFSRDLTNRLVEDYLRDRKGKEGVQDPILHQKAEAGVPVPKEDKEGEPKR